MREGHVHCAHVAVAVGHVEAVQARAARRLGQRAPGVVPRAGTQALLCARLKRCCALTAAQEPVTEIWHTWALLLGASSSSPAPGEPNPRLPRCGAKGRPRSARCSTSRAERGARPAGASMRPQSGTWTMWSLSPSSGRGPSQRWCRRATLGSHTWTPARRPRHASPPKCCPRRRATGSHRMPDAGKPPGPSRGPRPSQRGEHCRSQVLRRQAHRVSRHLVLGWPRVVRGTFGHGVQREGLEGVARLLLDRPHGA